MDKITVWLNGTMVAQAMPLDMATAIARRYDIRGYKVIRQYGIKRLIITA